MVAGIFSVFQVTLAADQSVNLQSLVDQAKPGDTITVPAGAYQGPLQINKPLKLIADQEVLIHGNGDAPILTIQADHVLIAGIHFVDERARDPKEGTVLVKGKDNVLKEVTIRTNGTGVQLREANRNLLDGVQVQGLTDARGETGSVMRGNGIDLWESYSNQIINSSVDNMYDGIYLENSSDNLIRSNVAKNSRYGYHLMFTKNNTIEENVGFHNVTGAMVMGSEQVKVQHNQFAKQNENVNSQGILLFDVKKTAIQANEVEGNRIGIYIESSSDNQILNNVLTRNFIGIQMIDAYSNELEGNEFVSNVIQAQAESSSDNRVQANYWDDMQGIDRTGSGRSDLAYQMNPFYITLTNDVKAFQIFFGSPGMEFLESLFNNPTDSWLKDRSPLMKPPALQGQVDQGVGYSALWFGLVLLVVSLLCIYNWGIVRK